MEDEYKLILLWTVFSVLVIIIYIWRRHKNLNSKKNTQGVVETSKSVQEARLKHFKFEENEDNSESKSSNEKNFEAQKQSETLKGQNETTFRRRKGQGKKKDSSTNQKVIVGPSAIFDERSEVGRHFDPDTGSPITQPLKTLEEAMLWRPGYDEFNVARVKLPPGCHGLENRPRTLVCHDMKGGYIEDRFVQGYPSSNCYRLYHWQYIDVFVYFSHHLVTIPPPCWTNAAHCNGVLVLGTLITEWDDGALRCSEFLEDEDSYKAFANQLVDISEYYNFDGWLVNIENPIQPGQVQNLVDFVDYLTKCMHNSNPASLVIWYDSVTNKGDLKWQDELNSFNCQYFDVCDGIFLNYNWSLHQLSVSGHAATAYQRSTADVFVGVDVFGRGCYEGGGYKTRLAVKAAREEKLSAAIFAPGWVFETQGEEKFTANENKFWLLLSKDCPTHPMVRNIPFVSSLCQGYGEKVFVDGKVVLSHPWTNLSCQQTQPSFNNAFYNLGKGGIVISDVAHSLDDAFNGGGCQLVQGRTSHTVQKAKGVVRLFEADFTFSSGILVSFTYKLVPADCFEVGLQFHTDRTPTYILLCPAPANQQDYAKGSIEDSRLNEMFKQKYGTSPSRALTSSVFMSPIGKEHFEAYAPLPKTGHHFVQKTFGVEGETGLWCTRHYLITGRHLVGCKVKEIRVVCAKPADEGNDGQGFVSVPFKLHIGEIKILDPIVLKQSIPTVSSLRHRNVVWKKDDHGNSLSLTLLWDYSIKSDVEKLSYFDVHVAIGHSQSQVFVGRAFVDSYRVCNLSVPRNVKAVEFIVQAVTISNRKQTLSNSTSIVFTWE